MALSLALFFGWQVTAAVLQRGALLRMAGQQAALAGQAAEAEGKLQSLIVDLLKLAETDPDAKAIVIKYRISMNAASQPVLSAGKPPAQPAPAAATPVRSP